MFDLTDREQSPGDEAYIQRFLRFSDAIERGIVRAAIVAFALLLVMQALLRVDEVRERVSGTERREGRVVNFAPPT